MNNLTDHRIDGFDVGRDEDRVRCTCSHQWMPARQFTLHIAEVAADTREQRIRRLEEEARKQMSAAQDALLRAKTFAIQAKASEMMAEQAARLAQNAASSTWEKAMKVNPKRKWWQA